MTELKLTEDVLEASQSLRDALSEFSAHSQSVKFVRLTNWGINAPTEVANQPQVQSCKVKKYTPPESLTGVRSDVAIEIGRPNSTPPFSSVPNLNISNKPSKNHSRYAVQPNASQP